MGGTASLEISTLGGLTIRLADEPVTALKTRKVEALLVYLACTAREHPRETLAELFWEERTQVQAMTNLRGALSSLRKHLEDYVIITRDSATLNPQAEIRLDVAELEENLVPVRDAETAAQVERAVELYAGPFLEGFYLRGARGFDEWATLERERLGQRVLQALSDLVAYDLLNGAFRTGIAHANRLLALDPLMESAHRQMMLLLAASGQRSAALAQYESCQRLLEEELGAEPSGETREVYELLLQGERPPGIPPAAEMVEREPSAVGACPYRGLAAFREQDAPFFFGREDFTARLFQAVHERPKVAVIVGSSGSGKSSAVFAGLVPRLREAGGWLVADFRPGDQPFHKLAAALLPLYAPQLQETDRLIEGGKIARAVLEGDLSLALVAEQTLAKHPGARRFLLVVDQFEELYTLCPEPQLRQRFLDGLLAAVGAEAARREASFVLLLTMRADFMGQALAYRPFADALQEASLMTGPMNRKELRAAIEKPAEMQGAAFEAGLVERLLNDVGQEPGNLPLLEFALTLLWERQAYGWMTHAGYEEIGRVEGALARYADQVFGELDAAEQEGARRVFVQLVRPGEGTEDTRRVATRAELGDADANWVLVQHLADKRLLVTGRDGAGNETVEVVHEALIQRWGQFRGWMAEDRAFRTWQERLRSALRGWETSDQDEGALLRGAPLAEAEGWLAEREDELSSAEKSFIQAGVKLRERRQRQREQRRRRTVLALAGGLVVTLVLALLSAQQWWRAEDQVDARATAEAVAIQEGQAAQEEADLRATAETDALRQASIGIASQALAELEGKFPERAIPLALEALEAYPYTWQAERALGQAVLESRLQLILSGHTGWINHAAWSPDGTQIATASDDGTAIVWDGTTGERQFTLTGHREELLSRGTIWKRVVDLAWSPDGTRIATAAFNTAKVWDAATGEEILSLAHSDFQAWISRVAWSPTGDHILTAHYSGKVRVRDATTGEELSRHQHAATVFAVAWSPSGDYVASSGDRFGVVEMWDAKTGRELCTLDRHKGAVNQVLWSPSGDQILTASDDHTVKLWDASPSSPTYCKELRTLTGHRDRVGYASWSPSGNRVATASRDATTRVWDLATGEVIYTFNEGDSLLEAQTSAVVNWSPSGDRIAANRSAGSITVFDAASGDEILTLSGHGGQILSAAWSPSGDRIVTAGRDFYVRVWDVSPHDRVLVGHADAVSGVDWSPSGDRLATASRDGTVRIWDAVTGEELLVRGSELLVTTSAVEMWRVATSAAEVWPVSWSPSGDRIGTATAELILDPAIRVWDALGSSPTFGKELLAKSGYRANDISWFPKGDRFVTSGSNGMAIIYDATTGKELRRFRGHSPDPPVTSADWSPDGERIVTSSAGDYAWVWDPDTGEALLRLQAEPAEGWMTVAAWSPDGNRIATHSPRIGRIWDATTGELRLTFSGHTGSVMSIVWSVTGDRLLTASLDETARIWDAQSGGELLSFSFNRPLGHAVWSPDMAHIAFGLGDGSVRIVDVHWHTTEELIAYARACCLIRELTADERELFGLPAR